MKALADLCEGTELKNEGSDSDKQKFIELKEAYKRETEEANEAKFSCIRRSVMPACYLAILYRHFFVKNDSEYSDIKTVNKFLYRALKLQNDDSFCVFVAQTLSIGLRKEVDEFENYHVNSSGELTIEVLNKKIGIYNFYFNEGEKLRELIGK